MWALLARARQPSPPSSSRTWRSAGAATMKVWSGLTASIFVLSGFSQLVLFFSLVSFSVESVVWSQVESVTWTRRTRVTAEGIFSPPPLCTMSWSCYEGRHFFFLFYSFLADLKALRSWVVVFRYRVWGFLPSRVWCGCFQAIRNQRLYFLRRTVLHNNVHMVCFSSYYCVRDGRGW
jgi:hypothetical protein